MFSADKIKRNLFQKRCHVDLHLAGSFHFRRYAKDSGEPEVAHCQREATAKSSECRERDQLVQPSVHLRQFHLTNARRMGSPCPMVTGVRLPTLIA